MAKEFDVIIIGGVDPPGSLPPWRLVERTGKILIVEEGKSLVDRVCPSKQRHIPCVKCQPCSIVCGWGGAGAFSDGKLTLSTEVGGFLDEYISKDRLHKMIRYVDDIYLRFGAPEQVYGDDEEKVAAIEKKAIQLTCG